MAELKTKATRASVPAYLKTVDDIDCAVLRKLIARSVSDMRKMYTCSQC